MKTTQKRLTGGVFCKTLGIIKKCITFGRAAEGLRADFQKQLLQLQREIGFSYVRFHGIFHDDMAVYRERERRRGTIHRRFCRRKRKSRRQWRCCPAY